MRFFFGNGKCKTIATFMKVFWQGQFEKGERSELLVSTRVRRHFGLIVTGTKPVDRQTHNRRSPAEPRPGNNCPSLGQ